jgi:DNA-binding NtrC family response regulator
MEAPIRVLIVEDDNAMAQMCAKLIRRRGHSAVIACSPDDAIRVVREAADIDVVISDMQMPQMNGIQLMSSLRAIDETLPIILMTGYAHLINPVQVIALGAADYIMKPFDADTLLTSVERAMRSRHNLTHN